MAIRAIETVYKGYRFRSRLEARWAVFFDALDIPYQYEKEGFNLDGVLYLPDFWLPQQRMWFEVKPTHPSVDECEKAKRLCKASGCTVSMGFDIPKDMGEFLDLPYEDAVRVGEDLGGAVSLSWKPSLWQWEARLRIPNENSPLVHPHITCFEAGMGHQWAICPICGYTDVCWMGHIDFLRCGCTPQCPDNWRHEENYTDHHPRITAAYDAARTARFEHGEHGARREREIQWSI